MVLGGEAKVKASNCKAKADSFKAKAKSFCLKAYHPCRLLGPFVNRVIMASVSSYHQKQLTELLCVFFESDGSVTSGISMAASSLAQFGLLLWKNWLLQKRRITVTAFQIVIPALLPLLLLPLCILVISKIVITPTIRDSFEASTFPPNLNPPWIKTAKVEGDLKWMLVFSPNKSKAVRTIARRTGESLDMMPSIGIFLLFTLVNLFMHCCVYKNDAYALR